MIEIVNVKSHGWSDPSLQNLGRSNVFANLGTQTKGCCGGKSPLGTMSQLRFGCTAAKQRGFAAFNGDRAEFVTNCARNDCRSEPMTEMRRATCMSRIRPQPEHPPYVNVRHRRANHTRDACQLPAISSCARKATGGSSTARKNSARIRPRTKPWCSLSMQRKSSARWRKHGSLPDGRERPFPPGMDFRSRRPAAGSLRNSTRRSSQSARNKHATIPLPSRRGHFVVVLAPGGVPPPPDRSRPAHNFSTAAPTPIENEQARLARALDAPGHGLRQAVEIAAHEEDLALAITVESVIGVNHRAKRTDA